MSNYFHAFKQSVKNWYIPLIIGSLLIILGIYLFTVPLGTYLTLALLFSISFLTSGVLDCAFAIQNHKTLNGWGWHLISGLLSLVIGVYLTSNPGLSMEILPLFVGFTLLFRSFLLLGYAFELKGMKSVSWGDIALLSVVGIIFSLLLLANPIFTGMSLVTLTALTFIFVGISSIMLSFKLKKVKNVHGKISSELKSKIESIQSEIEAEFGK